jgi:hypothetical protein
MQQDHQQQKESSPANESNTPSPDKSSEHIMVQNPNPRANENIRDTPMEDNASSSTTNEVGSEITDGEAG